jgi:tRNA dimethylallyltransferase
MPRIVCLMGPTASGKTALAAQWVQDFPFEIISVDSAMIYRDMNIGTAKPTVAELKIAPHHLIDILDPTESYSAATFCQDVKKLTLEILSRGKIPLLVGGTMMYFNALQKGLSVLPEADLYIRDALVQRAENEGWDVLHNELALKDKESALRINQQDKQRIIRALEVFYITGKTLSELRIVNKQSWDVDFINIILFPENRAWLHQRIAQRFDSMLAAGLIEETLALVEKWQLSEANPSMRSVGYRQVLAYLAGDFDKNILRDKGIAATRQLAKRQLTWLRSWGKAEYWDSESLNLQFCQDWISAKVFS